MYKLRKFYNQNRKGIWLIVIIIAFLLIILQLLNNVMKEKNIKEQEELKKLQENYINSGENGKSNIYNDTIEFGETIPQKVENEDLKTINKFIEYCKLKNIEEAYNMLTSECKEEMYPTKDKFQENYVSKIFTDENLEYSTTKWIENTYKIDFTIGNMLSSGNAENSRTMQDYISIINTKDGKKLNVNSYIKREELKKENEKDGIKVTVLESNIYMNYVTYKVKIENNTEKDILLDKKENTESMYILDQRNIKYAAFTHELTDADLTVTRNSSRTINIKYYSSYTMGKSIEQLVFSGIIMDYDSNNKIINSIAVNEIGVYI